MYRFDEALKEGVQTNSTNIYGCQEDKAWFEGLNGILRCKPTKWQFGGIKGYEGNNLIQKVEDAICGGSRQFSKNLTNLAEIDENYFWIYKHKAQGIIQIYI